MLLRSLRVLRALESFESGRCQPPHLTMSRGKTKTFNFQLSIFNSKMFGVGCKPGSVLLCSPWSVAHNRPWRSSLRHSSMHCALTQATLALYPSASGEQPYILPIYLSLQPVGSTVPGVLLPERWALTPPFHPYPSCDGRLFSVTFNLAVADNFPLRSTVLCVARTFLSLPKREAATKSPRQTDHKNK